MAIKPEDPNNKQPSDSAVKILTFAGPEISLGLLFRLFKTPTVKNDQTLDSKNENNPVLKK